MTLYYFVCAPTVVRCGAMKPSFIYLHFLLSSASVCTQVKAEAPWAYPQCTENTMSKPARTPSVSDLIHEKNKKLWHRKVEIKCMEDIRIAANICGVMKGWLCSPGVRNMSARSARLALTKLGSACQFVLFIFYSSFAKKTASVGMTLPCSNCIQKRRVSGNGAYPIKRAVAF